MLLGLLFIVDPLDELKAAKDSSIAMMREAAERGHEVYACTLDELLAIGGTVEAYVHRLLLSPPDQPDWYVDVGQSRRRLSSFEAVLMRKDPPFDIEFLNATLLLSRAAAQGAFVVNDPQALRDHNEKLAVLEFPELTVPTVVTRDIHAMRAFWNEHGDVVVKPLDGMGGAGIFRLAPGEANAGSIFETVTARGTRAAMAQRFIPEIVEGDKRVLVIGGAAVPFSLARVPAPGETRGNLAAGGRGEARPLTPREWEIARAVAPVLWAQGLLIVGLDVIGACLTEVNVTSPTCFVEITEQTGFDVPALFADALLRAVPH